MEFVKESVYESEEKFFSLLKEGLQNQFLNGLAINAYNNFVETVNNYKSIASQKNDRLKHSIFNQEARWIFESLSEIVDLYNDEHENYKISRFDIFNIANKAIYRTSLNESLDKVMGMDSAMLPKQNLENKVYFLHNNGNDNINNIDYNLKLKQEVPVLKYA